MAIVKREGVNEVVFVGGENDGVKEFPVMPPKPEMVRISGDLFKSYCESKNLQSPDVKYKDFEIAKTTVTFEEYDLFVFDTNRSLPRDENWGRKDRPVINISAFDAMEYTNWLSLKHYETPHYIIVEDKNLVYYNPHATGYRLPHPYHWICAADMDPETGKSSGYIYSGSDNIDEVAWYLENSNGRTHPVAQKKPNKLGLYDMTGNVWEMCLMHVQPLTMPVLREIKHDINLEDGAWMLENYKLMGEMDIYEWEKHFPNRPFLDYEWYKTY